MDEIVKINTISEMGKMMGGVEVNHPLISVIDFSNVDFESCAGIKFSAGFYSIMMKNLCPGSLRYGRNYYDFQDGSLFFVAPNQVLSLENPNLTKDVYGWSLSFHPDLIHGTSLSAKMRDYSFFSYNLTEALHLSEKEKAKLKELVENIQDELDQNIDRHSKTLIVSALELLLNYCTRFYDRQFITRSVKNKDLVSDFYALMEGYFVSKELSKNGLPSISYFAKKLNFSSNYLSDLLKKETGKNGTEHIQYHLIEVAKDKLLATSASVSEVAYDLGFEYPQYFSKLFKKRTGLTPMEFRTLN